MEKEDYTEEIYLGISDNAIPENDKEILMKLIKTHICKIHCKNGGHGTGFFCHIKDGSKTIKVLMTNYHVLGPNDILPGQTINVSINNEDKKFKIVIGNNRNSYANKKYDVTILEIKKEDKIVENSFFDLDNQIFQVNSYNIFKNCQVYLLHYPKGLTFEISSGAIKSISDEEDDRTIYHICDTDGGSSGSPLINKKNFNVIGIHKGGAKGGKKYNFGTLLKEPIEQFIKEIKMKKNDIDENDFINEINCIYFSEYGPKEIDLLHDYECEYLDNNKKYLEAKNMNKKIFEEYMDLYINGEKTKFNYKYKIKDSNEIKVKFKFRKILTNMSWMFYSCHFLKSIDLSSFNTTNVQDMSDMFFGCRSLKSIDLSSFNITNVKSMNSMFYDCSS